MEQTAVFGCVGAGSEWRRGSSSGEEELRWSKERRRWCWCCFLQVRASEHVLFGVFGFIWATILCDSVYWGLIEIWRGNSSKTSLFCQLRTERVLIRIFLIVIALSQKHHIIKLIIYIYIYDNNKSMSFCETNN